MCVDVCYSPFAPVTKSAIPFVLLDAKFRTWGVFALETPGRVVIQSRSLKKNAPSLDVLREPRGVDGNIHTNGLVVIKQSKRAASIPPTRSEIKSR